MAVSEDRKFTKEQVYNLLEGAKGKTLGEVDKSHQFARTLESTKITGIAGDVIEQSVFGYKKDSKQECDIEIDGVLTEVKTTGVRVPKRDQKNANGKTGEAYNVYLGAKEGISITHVTFEPPIQTDFDTSHFWEKTERLLIIFYEYKSYEVVPASGYAKFPIVDYCYNSFSQEEKDKLQNDWEIVSSHLQQVYHDYQDAEKRNEQLVGFTHLLRPNLLLIELVPGFKRTATGSYQKPRYRLKQTFVDYIVRGHFFGLFSELNPELKINKPKKSYTLDMNKSLLVGFVKEDNTDYFLDGSQTKIYYTGKTKSFPSTVALNKLYYFMPYIKGKGVKDLYLIRIARIGCKAEIHPESNDKDPRLVFELEYLESLPNYMMLKPNIFNTYRNTVLGRVMGEIE